MLRITFGLFGTATGFYPWMPGKYCFSEIFFQWFRNSEMALLGGIPILKCDHADSMGRVSGKKEAVELQDEYLSAEEVIAAFDALSATDKLKLNEIERVRRGGTTFARGDLLHVALCDAILGKRHCPRNLPVIAFLAQTMRSIAFHEREKLKRQIPLYPVEQQGEARGAILAASKAMDDLAVDERERAARSQDTVDTILKMFEDDETAQLILLGWIDGYRGAQLREVTGLDQAGLDYAIKRIRIKMKKYYPDGWKS